jgi:hypothetical protein
VRRTRGVTASHPRFGDPSPDGDEEIAKGPGRNGAQKSREVRSCAEERASWWKGKKVVCCGRTGTEGLKALIKFRAQSPCFKEKKFKVLREEALSEFYFRK